MEISTSAVYFHERFQMNVESPRKPDPGIGLIVSSYCHWVPYCWTSLKSRNAFSLLRSEHWPSLSPNNLRRCGFPLLSLVSQSFVGFLYTIKNAVLENVTIEKDFYFLHLPNVIFTDPCPVTGIIRALADKSYVPKILSIGTCTWISNFDVFGSFSKPLGAQKFWKKLILIGISYIAHSYTTLVTVIFCHPRIEPSLMVIFMLSGPSSCWWTVASPKYKGSNGFSPTSGKPEKLQFYL